MTQSIEKRLYMSAHGIRAPIGPDDAKVRSYHEFLIRGDYDRIHSRGAFEWLKHLAQFAKQDQGLLRDWMAVAAFKAQQRDKEKTPRAGNHQYQLSKSGFYDLSLNPSSTESVLSVSLDFPAGTASLTIMIIRAQLTLMRMQKGQPVTGL